MSRQKVSSGKYYIGKKSIAQMCIGTYVIGTFPVKLQKVSIYVDVISTIDVLQIELFAFFVRMLSMSLPMIVYKEVFSNP